MRRCFSPNLPSVSSIHQKPDPLAFQYFAAAEKHSALKLEAHRSQVDFVPNEMRCQARIDLAGIVYRLSFGKNISFILVLMLRYRLKYPVPDRTSMTATESVDTDEAVSAIREIFALHRVQAILRSYYALYHAVLFSGIRQSILRNLNNIIRIQILLQFPLYTIQ